MLQHGLADRVAVELAAPPYVRWREGRAVRAEQHPFQQCRCLQPFGGSLSGFRTFDGFTLPTHLEAGNGFGTDDCFASFVADVTDGRFPTPEAVGR